MHAIKTESKLICNGTHNISDMQCNQIEIEINIVAANIIQQQNMFRKNKVSKVTSLVSLESVPPAILNI